MFDVFVNCNESKVRLNCFSMSRKEIIYLYQALELQDVNISVIVDNKEIDIKEFIKG